MKVPWPGMLLSRELGEDEHGGWSRHVTESLIKERWRLSCVLIGCPVTNYLRKSALGEAMSWLTALEGAVQSFCPIVPGLCEAEQVVGSDLKATEKQEETQAPGTKRPLRAWPRTHFLHW